MEERNRTIAICTSSVLAVGLAFMAHESAHVLAGWLTGGTPTLLTATEVRGEFDSLTAGGFVAFGAAGSLVNLLLSGLGWWLLGSGRATAEWRLTAWFLFAVNGMLLTTKMMAESIAGWGDWMTILRPLPATDLLRVMVAAVGVVGLIFMVRRSGVALARLLPEGEPRERVAEARRIVLIGAAAAAVLVLGTSVANPAGTARGALLAVGGGVGPFVPMLFGTRFGARVPAGIAPRPATVRWPWLLAASATAILMWFGFGPGIRL